jgi:hypothetical protein
MILLEADHPADKEVLTRGKRGSACRKESNMDALLSKYTDEQLISELEKGHRWFHDGDFCASPEKLAEERFISVENAVFYRYYC